MNLNFGHMAATDKQALHCSVKLETFAFQKEMVALRQTQSKAVHPDLTGEWETVQSKRSHRKFA